MVVCWVLGLVWVVGVGLGGRGCTSVAEDGGGNPLVVGRQDTVGAFSGLRVVEDAAQLVADLRNRNWVDAAVDQAGAVASVAGAAADPLGEAIAAGVAWVLDHLGALREWLDGLAGDPGAVAGGAATWANVSTYLTECAQDLDRSLQTTLADQRCLTVGAYRDYQGVTVKNLESAAGMAGAVAAALEVASMIVQVVHDMVRDAIADVIGKASSKLILTAVTAGVAAPWAVASVTADVLEWVTYLSGRVKGILRSSSNLGDRLRQVRDLLEEIRTTMSRALSPAGPVPAMAAAGAGGSRPRGGRPRTATGSKNGGGGGGGRKPPTKTPGDDKPDKGRGRKDDNKGKGKNKNSGSGGSSGGSGPSRTPDWSDPAERKKWFDGLKTQRVHSSSPAYSYQHRVLGTDVERRLVSDGGEEIFADAVTPDGSAYIAWDAKHSGGGRGSLYEGNASPKLQDILISSFDDEMQRYKAIIKSDNNPVNRLILVTNTPEAQAYLYQRALKALGGNIPFEVRLIP